MANIFKVQHTQRMVIVYRQGIAVYHQDIIATKDIVSTVSIGIIEIVGIFIS